MLFIKTEHKIETFLTITGKFSNYPISNFNTSGQTQTGVTIPLISIMQGKENNKIPSSDRWIELETETLLNHNTVRMKLL
jgi:hypothetical protein